MCNIGTCIGLEHGNHTRLQAEGPEVADECQNCREGGTGSMSHVNKDRSEERPKLLERVPCSCGDGDSCKPCSCEDGVGCKPCSCDDGVGRKGQSVDGCTGASDGANKEKADE